jgi:integrase
VHSAGGTLDPAWVRRPKRRCSSQRGRASLATAAVRKLEKLVALPYPRDAFGQIEPTLYLTAAMTGVRQGELLGLRRRDIDLHARKLRVVSPYVRGEFNDPKSDGFGRSVPLAQRVADALQSLRDETLYPTNGALALCHPGTDKSLDV